MNIYFKLALGAAVVGGAAYAVHWHGETNYKRGYDAREAIAVKSELHAAQIAKKETDRLNDLVAAAEKKGKEREDKLLADATSARSAADRLRDEITGLRARIPYLTEQAVRKYADAASVVFAECNAEYTALAKRADQIDSDRQKLEDAWPK